LREIIVDDSIGCSVAEKIQVPDGFPKCRHHSTWLGELKGSWYDIGREYGKASALYARCVFDYWWESAILSGKRNDILNYLHKLEDHVMLLNPKLLDMIRGEAEGASVELDKCEHARECTNYEKLLFIENAMCYFIHGMPGARGARVSKAYGTMSELSAIPVEATDCTEFAIWGDATADGELIVSYTQQFGWWISNYRFSFIATPTDGERANSFLCCTSAGMITGGLFSCNSAGVGVGSTAGGEDPAVDELDWGIPASFLRLQAVAYSNSKEQASEIITKGTESYRRRSGRKVLLEDAPYNWLVADEDGAFVIERTAHRYAIRHPPPIVRKRNFVIATNHQFCERSYDENDVESDTPMYKITGDTDSDVAELGKFPSPGTVTRYHAIRWACEYNYGRIDERMVQGHEFTAGHHWYSRDGKKIEHLWSDLYKNWMPVHYLYPHSTVCGHSGGYPEKYHNELPSVIMFKPSELKAQWTVYKPCFWVGPWENSRFEA